MKEQKKKIVLLSAFYEPFMSGAEQMVKEIAEKLGSRYDIVLITARLDANLETIEERPTFTLVRVGFGNFLDKYLYAFLASWKLRQYKPDIVHAIMESYAGGALFFSKYTYGQAKRVLTLQSDLNHYSAWKVFLMNLFWKITHSAADHITSISNFLIKRTKSFGISEEKIELIPNGVDFSKIKDSTVIRQKNKVLAVGRLNSQKGLEYLLQAWPDILKSVPDAQLVIVGEGDMRGELESMIDNLKIQDSVVLKGNKSHKEVLLEMQEASVFVLPSLAEGQGIVFIEAQMCGLPVIGTNVGGIVDIIQNNKNGLLIKPRSAEVITKAVISILTDDELANNLRQNALKTVRQYDWKLIIDKIEHMYEALV